MDLADSIGEVKRARRKVRSNPLFYPLLLITLVVLCLLVHVGLPDDSPHVPKTPLDPKPRRRRRSKEPRPFAGLIHQPLCEACEQDADTPQGARVTTACHHLHTRTPAHC